MKSRGRSPRYRLPPTSTASSNGACLCRRAICSASSYCARPPVPKPPRTTNFSDAGADCCAASDRTRAEANRSERMAASCGCGSEYYIRSASLVDPYSEPPKHGHSVACSPAKPLAQLLLTSDLLARRRSASLGRSPRPWSEQMGRKLFVGNLPYDSSEGDLQELFARHGTV